MSSLVHLVPYTSDEEAKEHFKQDHRTLIHLLESSFDGLFLDIYTPDIHSPYPIGITLSSFYRMRKISRVICKALHAIVTNYFKDERLCNSLLELSPDAQSLLSLMEGKPYSIGSWRPDLLFPVGSSDSFVICEINARYAFNGYFCSHEKNRILDQIPYLNRVPMMPVTELRDIPDLFRCFFDKNKVVGILKSNPVDGWDVKMFRSCVADAQESHYKAEINKSVEIPLLAAPLEPPADRSSSPPPLPRLQRDDSSSFPSPPVNVRQASSELSKLGAASNSIASTSPVAYNANVEMTPEVGVRFLNPRDLAPCGGSGGVCDSVGQVEQFAIECSQAELLAMDRDILAHVITCPHINDIRTIFLAHDKRMLSVLTTPDIMKNYLDPDEVNLLQSCVIDTYICGIHKEIVNIAKRERSNWIFKPNGGGKGIGIVFGRDCSSDEQWAALLDDPAHSLFILQQVVAQQVVDIQRETSTQEMLVVGMMHCFNDKFLGPGIFRASSLDQPIVNVSGGNGIILSPAVLSSRWKLIRQGVSNSASSDNTAGCVAEIRCADMNNMLLELPDECVFHINASSAEPSTPVIYDHYKLDDIWETLNKEGIALVHCPWRDFKSIDAGGDVKGVSKIDSDRINSALLDLIRQLGGNPHSHTLGGPEEQVWDVRPFFESIHSESSQGGNGGAPTPPLPRSHTADEFDMHTDCSFEDPPPRYVALYVVREDQCGGGRSTLIDTDALNRYISRKSLQTLMNTDFTVSVPPEFFKGQESIKMKLVTREEKLWKYRSDIIDRNNCTDAQLSALDELDSLLRSPSLVLTTMLPTGSLLLLDNMRWFHGRSAIKDQNRWLKRVRFHPMPDRQPPCIKRLVSRTDSLVKAQWNDVVSSRTDAAPGGML